MFQTCPWTAGASKQLCTLVMVAYELLLGFRLIPHLISVRRRTKRENFVTRSPKKRVKWFFAPCWLASWVTVTPEQRSGIMSV